MKAVTYIVHDMTANESGRSNRFNCTCLSVMYCE